MELLGRRKSRKPQKRFSDVVKEVCRRLVWQRRKLEVEADVASTKGSG